MGVPGFFAWLLRNYKKKKIISKSIDSKVDVLYLDANCLFHPQCFKTLEHFMNLMNDASLERKMIRRILAYIDFLIDFVNPNETFMSVDGVAPMAKMNQQRKRRYRSGDDNDIKNAIKLKHGRPIGKQWSNTVITPGTEFMENLHQKILQHMKKRSDVKITYSSYHTPGEGEHKILQDLKSRAKHDQTATYVIYGLDADLIFLALASQKSNIYLLREAQHLGTSVEIDKDLQGDFFEDVSEELNYVSIDEMVDCINDTITRSLTGKLNDSVPIQTTNFSDDFIFICYLLGNDFLPHLPSVDIKTGGLDFIIDCYCDVYKLVESPIITRKNDMITINESFFILLIKEVAKYEEYYFSKRLPKYKETWENRRCPTSDSYEREIWELENMINVKINDPIKLGEDDPELYKYRYYEHYFGINENQADHIKRMSTEYIKGVIWVFRYYFDRCPSWEWQYLYTHAPFISDISKHIDSIKTFNVDFGESSPLNPFTQLLSVLPPSCSNILPKEYRHLITSDTSPLIDMYPQKIELDMLNKCMYYQCIPLIPCIDIDRLKKAIKNLKLTKEESVRNSTLPNFKNFP